MVSFAQPIYNLNEMAKKVNYNSAKNGSFGSSSVITTSGYSTNSNLRCALDEIVSQVNRNTAGLTFCFLSGYKISELIHFNLNEWFPQGIVMACTGAAVITSRSYPKRGVVVTCISNSVITAVSDRIITDDNLRLSDIRMRVTRLSRKLEKKMGVIPFKDVFAILLMDGMQNCEEKVASAVGSQLRGVPLCGGSATDSMQFTKTAIYSNGEWLDGDSALVLAHTRLAFEVFSTHHYTSMSERIVISSADPSNRKILEMNGRPAAQEYARLIGCAVEELNTDILSQYAMLVNIGGRQYVRSVIRANKDDSLTFACAVDEGVVMHLARGMEMVKNIEQTLERVRSHIGTLELVLGFNCAYRELEMRRFGLTREILKIFRQNNVVGFSAFGEQIHSMHVNQTFTGIALSESGEAYETKNT